MKRARANAAALAGAADCTLAEILERTPSRALLSIADISAAVGVSGSLVRGWIKCGALSCVRIGNGKKRPRKRVARNAFARFIARRIVAEVQG